MTKTSTRALASAAFLSGALGLATAAVAQGMDRPALPTAWETAIPTANPTADQLDQEAARLRDSVTEYARAVRLLEQSVALREVGVVDAAVPGSGSHETSDRGLDRHDLFESWPARLGSSWRICHR